MRDSSGREQIQAAKGDIARGDIGRPAGLVGGGGGFDEISVAVQPVPTLRDGLNGYQIFYLVHA